MHSSRLSGSLRSAIVKRSLLASVGAIVSFLLAAVMQPAAAGDPRDAAIRGQLATPPDGKTNARVTGELPRGNLRGDIVNNARSRSDAPRGNADRGASGEQKTRGR
jgi:hypothetical protein